MKDTIFYDAEESDEQTEENTSAPKLNQIKTNTKRNIFLLIVIIISSAFVYSRFLQKSPIKQEGVGLVAAAQQSVSPNQNSVLLTVNGKPIQRKFYSLSINNIVQLAEQQKLDLTNPETQTQIKNLALANIVNTSLLVDKAQQEGMHIDQAKIDENYANVVSRSGSTDKFDQGLNALGMTADDLKGAIRDELLASEYIAKAVDVSKVTVSEEELKKYYDDIKAKSPKDKVILPYKEMKSQIEPELRLQKQQELIQEYLGNLRKDAKIEQGSQS